MGVFEDVIMEAGTASVTPRRNRRKQPRLPNLHASSTGLSANFWELELLPPQAVVALKDDIAALAVRAMEPNVFLDPMVLQSAWPRLNGLLAKRGCWMGFLWETIGDKPRRLRLFVPLAIQKTGLPPRKVLQPLSNEFMPLGTPLLDPATAEEACETLLQLLADPKLQLPPVLDLTSMRAQGETTRQLTAAAKRLGLPARGNNRYERAVLTTASRDTLTSLNAIAGKHRAKEFRRLNRRLEEQAPVTFVVHRQQEAVLDAFEAFVALELSGWKGRRSTSLYNYKKINVFSREITGRLAVENAAEIFEMRHGDRVIGSLILLGRGGNAVTWKVAYDEAFRRVSPGLQVTVQATLSLLKRKNFKEADSLAVPDHPMINRLWPERVQIGDLTIALDCRGTNRLNATLAAKARRARLVQLAKRLLALAP